VTSESADFRAKSGVLPSATRFDIAEPVMGPDNAKHVAELGSSMKTMIRIPNN
jgi:hypothetical protein